MGPTEINQDGSFYRTQRSSVLVVLKLGGGGGGGGGFLKRPPPPPPPPQKKKRKKKGKKKNQFNHCQTVWLFQWFTYVHLCFTANTLQDSYSHENHNELYNYALVKFLVLNRVNMFAIYLLVIERCF